MACTPLRTLVAIEATLTGGEGGIMAAFLAGQMAAYLLADFLKSFAKYRPDLLAGRFD